MAIRMPSLQGCCEEIVFLMAPVQCLVYRLVARWEVVVCGVKVGSYQRFAVGRQRTG